MLYCPSPSHIKPCLCFTVLDNSSFSLTTLFLAGLQWGCSRCRVRVPPFPYLGPYCSWLLLLSIIRTPVSAM